MTQTVAGPEALLTRPEDIAALERRRCVQACFHETDVAATVAEMVQHNVSAAELKETMDFKLDTTLWLRTKGVPDGFQGLKVWSNAEIDKFIDWKLPQQNPFGGGKTFAETYKADGVDPRTDKQTRAAIQDVLDREHARVALDPSLKLPWMI